MKAWRSCLCCSWCRLINSSWSCWRRMRGRCWWSRWGRDLPRSTSAPSLCLHSTTSQVQCWDFLAHTVQWHHAHVLCVKLLNITRKKMTLQKVICLLSGVSASNGFLHRGPSLRSFSKCEHRAAGAAAHPFTGAAQDQTDPHRTPRHGRTTLLEGQ